MGHPPPPDADFQVRRAVPLRSTPQYPCRSAPPTRIRNAPVLVQSAPVTLPASLEASTPRVLDSACTSRHARRPTNASVSRQSPIAGARARANGHRSGAPARARGVSPAVTRAMQNHPETFWEWGSADVDICAYLNERLQAGEYDVAGTVTETAVGDDVAEAALQACWTTVQTRWREAQFALLTELLQTSVEAMPEVVRGTERARQRVMSVQARTQREVDGPPPESAGASATGELAVVLRSLSTADRVLRLVREGAALLQSAAAAERSSARLSTLHESGDLLAYADALGQLRRALRQLRATPDRESFTQEWQTRMQSASDTLAERLRPQLQNCVESVDAEALANDQHTPAERECRQLRECYRRAGMEDRFRDACVDAIVQGVVQTSRRRLDDPPAARRLWHSVDEAHVTAREGDHPSRMRWRQVEAAAASRRRVLPLDRVPDLQAAATAIAQHLTQVATDLQRYRKWWTALNADIAAGPAAEDTSNAMTVESPRSASHDTATTASDRRNARSPTTDDSAADFHGALLLQVAEAVLPSLTALLCFTHAAPLNGQRAAGDVEMGTSYSIEAQVTAIFDATDQWAHHVLLHGNGSDIPDDRPRGDATSLLRMIEETSRRPRLADALDACTLPSLVYASNLGFYFLPELTAPLTAAANNPHAQRWSRVRQQLPRLRALATALELNGAAEVEPTIARALAETARAVDATAEPYGAVARRLARTCAERTGGLALSASVLPALDRAAERLLEEVRQVAALGLASQRRARQQLPRATWSASVGEATTVADASPLRSALELLYALASWMVCWREARREAVEASQEAARQLWEVEKPHERHGDTASSRTPLSLRWRWHSDPDVMATLQALVQADQRPMEAAATAAVAVQLADTVQITHRLVLETLTHGMRERIAALGSAEGAVSAYPSLALVQPETDDDGASGFAVGPSPAAAQLGERLLACAQLLESVLLLAGRGDRLALAAPLDARHPGDAQHTAELVQQALHMNHASGAAPPADAALSQAAVARAARPWIGAVSHHVMQCLTERRRRVDSTAEEDPRQLAADLEYLRDVLRALGFPPTTE